MTPLLLHGPVEFPLRERLKLAQPIERLKDGSSIFFARETLGPLTDRLAFFALSIFWRGSVTQWPLTNMKSRKNFLGDKYQEGLRLYLLGEEGCPKDIILVIKVADDEDLYPIVSFPSFKRHGEFHYHWCHVAGLDLHLFVGNRVPATLRPIRGDGQLEIPIFLQSFAQSPQYGLIARMAQTSQPKGAVARKNSPKS